MAGEGDTQHQILLICSVERGNEAGVARALKDGARPDHIDTITGQTCLHKAARIGDRAILKRLLGAPLVSPDAMDKWGKSPLMVAVESDQKDCVELLLDLGASPTLESSSGEQPLFLACLFGHLGLVKLLKNKGVNVLKLRDRNGSNALHYAVRQGAATPTLISFLLGEGLNPSEANSLGDTSLQLAQCYMPDSELCWMLQSNTTEREQGASNDSAGGASNPLDSSPRPRHRTPMPLPLPEPLIPLPRVSDGGAAASAAGGNSPVTDQTPVVPPRVPKAASSAAGGNSPVNVTDQTPVVPPRVLKAKKPDNEPITVDDDNNNNDMREVVKKMEEEMEKMRQKVEQQNMEVQLMQSRSESQLSEILTLMRQPSGTDPPSTAAVAPPTGPVQRQTSDDQPVLSERFLLGLADNISGSDGYRLAINLGFTMANWTVLEQKFLHEPNKAVMELLCMWMRRGDLTDKDSKIKELTSALRGIGRCDLADSVDRLVRMAAGADDI